MPPQRPSRKKQTAEAVKRAAIQTSEAPVQVSAAWLLKALAVTLAVAACCGWIALCLLFWQGQWQLIFQPARQPAGQPSRQPATTPASAGLAFDDIRFGATETGTPQLDGWWLPADASGRYANFTLVAFPDRTGSMAQLLPRLQSLHELGFNVFAFDYRGFGKSADAHPSERSVYEDADAAWTYLTETRHLNPHTLVLFGEGLGATVAARAAARHPEAPAIILENPAPSGEWILRSDPRTRLLPLWLLLRDRLDPQPILAALTTPKLILVRESGSADTALTQRAQQLFHAAADPKSFAEVNTGADGAFEPRLQESLRRFLDDSLPGR